MTLDELLPKTAAEWDKITPAEMEEWAKQYFCVTRPDEAKKIKVLEEKAPRQKSNMKVDHIEQARELARKMGIKI